MLNPISANPCLKTVSPTAVNLFKSVSYLQQQNKLIFFLCGGSLEAALGTLQLVSALCLLAQRNELVVNLFPCCNGTGFNIRARGIWGQWSVFCLGLFLNTKAMVSLLVLASFQVHAILHLKIFSKSWAPSPNFFLAPLFNFITLMFKIPSSPVHVTGAAWSKSPLPQHEQRKLLVTSLGAIEATPVQAEKFTAWEIKLEIRKVNEDWSQQIFYTCK